MKANPGGTVTGKAIIGRSREIDLVWDKLTKRSILLSAERRVGKTSLLRKLAELPRTGWTPLLVWVESARHPIECVEAIYQKAEEAQLSSTKRFILKRVRDAYTKLTSAEVKGWKLPQLESDWKRLLRLLVEDIVENSETGAVIILDEFPLMVWNIADDHGAAAAMQFLDALREIRQEFEPTGKLRFILCGSIGFHLVLQHLKDAHGYKGAPTNDMHSFVLTGLDPGDTELMCCRYLDEEKIRRDSAEGVAARMQLRTDGLPLYIQYICEALQDEKREAVAPDDIDRVLDGMLAARSVTWFRDAANRIDSYYSKFGCDATAAVILNRLSHEADFFPEASLHNAVRAKDANADDRKTQKVIELLQDDNYIVRDTSAGERRYRFRYRLMREWWKINRG